MVLVQVGLKVIAHRYLGQSDKPELDVLELAQEIRQRAHRAAVGEVSDHRHPDAVDLRQLGADGEQVEQGLGRMLARAVPRIDDWDVADRGGAFGRALFPMPQDDHVRIAAHDSDGVFESLAFGRGGEFAGVVGAHRLAAEAQHGRLERKPGAGGWFVEESRHHLARQPAHETVRLALDLLGTREQLLEEGPTELLALDYMPESRRNSHEKISFPGSQART